jgi:hypothetical protein
MTRIPFLWILLFAALLIFACAGPSRIEKDYGTSVKFSRSEQILDPEGGKNLEPVTGLDGRVAHTIVEKYRKSFEEARQTPQYIYQPQGGSK